MNDFEEIIQAIYIGVVVATFLYMTGRAQKAIELCKESLVLLNNKTLEFNELLYEAIYKLMFEAYILVRDYTNAIAYGRKLLANGRDSGETIREGKICTQLAAMHQLQHKYVEAKQLYMHERAISIFYPELLILIKASWTSHEKLTATSIRKWIDILLLNLSTFL